MRVYLFQTFERFFVLFIRENYPRDNYVRAKTWGKDGENFEI